MRKYAEDPKDNKLKDIIEQYTKKPVLRQVPGTMLQQAKAMGMNKDLQVTPDNNGGFGIKFTNRQLRPIELNPQQFSRAWSTFSARKQREARSQPSKAIPRQAPGSVPFFDPTGKPLISSAMRQDIGKRLSLLSQLNKSLRPQQLAGLRDTYIKALNTGNNDVANYVATDPRNMGGFYTGYFGDTPLTGDAADYYKQFRENGYNTKDMQALLYNYYSDNPTQFQNLRNDPYNRTNAMLAMANVGYNNQQTMRRNEASMRANPQDSAWLAVPNHFTRVGQEWAELFGHPQVKQSRLNAQQQLRIAANRGLPFLAWGSSPVNTKYIPGTNTKRLFDTVSEDPVLSRNMYFNMYRNILRNNPDMDKAKAQQLAKLETNKAYTLLQGGANKKFWASNTQQKRMLQLVNASGIQSNDRLNGVNALLNLQGIGLTKDDNEAIATNIAKQQALIKQYNALTNKQSPQAIELYKNINNLSKDNLTKLNNSISADPMLTMAYDAAASMLSSQQLHNIRTNHQALVEWQKQVQNDIRRIKADPTGRTAIIYAKQLLSMYPDMANSKYSQQQQTANIAKVLATNDDIINTSRHVLTYGMPNQGILYAPRYNQVSRQSQANIANMQQAARGANQTVGSQAVANLSHFFSNASIFGAPGTYSLARTFGLINDPRQTYQQFMSSALGQTVPKTKQAMDVFNLFGATGSTYRLANNITGMAAFPGVAKAVPWVAATAIPATTIVANHLYPRANGQHYNKGTQVLYDLLKVGQGVTQGYDLLSGGLAGVPQQLIGSGVAQGVQQFSARRAQVSKVAIENQLRNQYNTQLATLYTQWAQNNPNDSIDPAKSQQIIDALRNDLNSKYRDPNFIRQQSQVIQQQFRDANNSQEQSSKGDPVSRATYNALNQVYTVPQGPFNPGMQPFNTLAPQYTPVQSRILTTFGVPPDSNLQYGKRQADYQQALNNQQQTFYNSNMDAASANDVLAHSGTANIASFNNVFAPFGVGSGKASKMFNAITNWGQAPISIGAHIAVKQESDDIMANDMKNGRITPQTVKRMVFTTKPDMLYTDGLYSKYSVNSPQYRQQMDTVASDVAKQLAQLSENIDDPQQVGKIQQLIQRLQHGQVFNAQISKLILDKYREQVGAQYRANYESQRIAKNKYYGVLQQLQQLQRMMQQPRLTEEQKAALANAIKQLKTSKTQYQQYHKQLYGGPL